MEILSVDRDFTDCMTPCLSITHSRWPKTQSEAKELADEFRKVYDLPDGYFDWDVETQKFEIRWPLVEQYLPEAHPERFGALNTLSHPEWLGGRSTWSLRYTHVVAHFDPQQEKVELHVLVDDTWVKQRIDGATSQTFLIDYP